MKLDDFCNTAWCFLPRVLFLNLLSESSSSEEVVPVPARDPRRHSDAPLNTFRISIVTRRHLILPRTVAAGQFSDVRVQWEAGYIYGCLGGKRLVASYIQEGGKSEG